MLWQQQPDCYHEFIASNVRRDEVESILTCLHFADNTKLDNDGYYKARPIFESLNIGGRFFTDEQRYSIEECMIHHFIFIISANNI